MSTETAVQTPTAGTPLANAGPITKGAKSMIGDAFKAATPENTPSQSKVESTPPPGAESPKTTTTQPAKEASTSNPEQKTQESSLQPLPEDLIEMPKNASPETAKNFAAYKEKMKSIINSVRTTAAEKEKQVAKLQADFEAYKKTVPQDDGEKVKMREELKSLSERLMVLDLKNHPDFHKQYEEPRKAAIAESQSLLADNNIKEPVDFDALLAKPRAEFSKTVSELASKMNSFDAQTFTDNMRKSRMLAENSEKALANASQMREQLSSKSAQVQRQAFEEVTGVFTKQEFLKPRPIEEGMSPEDRASVEGYNSQLQGLRSNAEKYAFGKLDERGVAELAHKAAALDLMVSHTIPTLQKIFIQKNQDFATLAKEYEAIKGSRSPNASGTERSQTPQKAKSAADLIRSSGAFKH